MINQVRTLLMNRAKSGQSLLAPGEEYIEANYIPKALNQPLQMVQRALFGASPDRLFVNYRMRQIMQLMHATPMEGDIFQDDCRVTYLPFKPDLFSDAFETTVTQTAGAEPLNLTIAGQFNANMSLGLSKQTWDIAVMSGGNIQVSKRKGRQETATVHINGDQPVDLMGSNLQVFLHGAPVGSQLQIDASARPDMDVSQTLINMSSALGQDGINDIFPMMPTEPLVTWQRIWSTHPASAMRFTALLLAIAYRTAQMPQGATGG